MNYSDYIEIKTNTSRENQSFLVDSQADICAIKLKSLPTEIKINTYETIEITGVTKTPIHSIGIISIQLFIENIIITHKFHVMPDDFNIPSDAIIGRDFNTLYNCILDYGTQQYTIRTEQGNVSIPIKIHTKNNRITLPARAETTRIFTFSCKQNLLVKAQQLQPGVMTSNTIARNGIAQIHIINCTNQVQNVQMPKFETEKIEKYHVYTVNRTENKETRTQKLIEILAKSYPKDEKLHNKLNKLCAEYADIFALETDTMTVNNFYSQDIKIKSTEPVFTRNYRTPYTQKQEIKRQVEKLIKNDLIEASCASYNSPIILVPKRGTGPEKKWRMCIDYRALNKNIIADKFPLPRIDDILDNLGKAKYFSVVDLFSGFHQVPLNESSRDYTTFSTENGSYRWKVLPFGLNISPNSFSRMMTIAFSGLPPEKAFLYIDDMIVIGRTENDHMKNLESVFKILRDRNLKLNAEKCKFFQPEVTFLGHKCTEQGILPDDTKIKSLRNYPKPHDKDAVKRFVAFANYYRKFIYNFAEIAQPLSELTRKSTEFTWEEKHERAFETLKNALTTPQILQYPNFDNEFIIKVDASSLGCAGVLLQERNGIDLPVAYFSKSFQKAEKNKAIIEKELLAIYHSIVAFRPYIYGKKFTVYTDHKPLIYLFTMKNIASKLVRIKLELEEYDFDILHIKGKDNIQADALSRMPFSVIKTMNEQSKQVLAITRSMTRKKKQENNERDVTDEKKSEDETKIYEKLSGFDKNIARIKTYINTKNELIIGAHIKHKRIFELTAHTNEKLLVIISKIEEVALQNGINKIQWATNDKMFEIFNENEIKNVSANQLKTLRIELIRPVIHVKDEKEKERILKEYHYDRIRGGHCGRNRLYAKLRSQFYWRKMSKDVTKLVKNCMQCKLNKPRPGTREPMAITTTPQKAFEVIILDTIGPMNKTIYGNTYAITLICDLTKYLITVSIPNKEAKTVAKAIFENLILIYGTPKTIRTDLGTEFKNEIFNELCKLLNVQHHFSTAYHHESLGSIERNHRIFNEYLRAYSNDDTWDINLRYFTYCYNTSFNASLNHEYTPFELVFGKKTTQFEWINDKIEPIYNMDDYAKILKKTLQTAQERANKFIEKIKHKNKQYYDTKTNEIKLTLGDLVLVKKEPYEKFKSIFSGPYKIKQIEQQNVTIEINNKPYKIHKNRVVKL